jgi:predicted dithiol-disulfide oxidoreductase (DUF899 family)
MDHTDGALVHLAQRDVSFTAVSRAPLSKIEPFKKRLGWRFAWVSSFGTDFNHDYRASFTQDEMAKGKVEYNFDLVEFPSTEARGISVFYQDKSGNIFPHLFRLRAWDRERSQHLQLSRLCSKRPR